VIPVVVQALAYDVRRGAHSVGAHVRDAASYVCWAFARAYAADVMEKWMVTLAPALLTVAVFDREVNCRRACSAAFQEAVGRLGNFPHGIDLVTICDYFTVGNRTSAYCCVAKSVAEFSIYRRALVDHLLETKLMHWERATRELAADALAALTPIEPGLIAAPACIQPLVARTLSTDLPTRHGAVVALARVLPALSEAATSLGAAEEELVIGAVPAIEKARLYRGKGGEVMRSAVCRLIAAISRSQFTLPLPIKRALHTSIDENLRHPTEEIQVEAAAALEAFSGTYMKRVSPEALARTVTKYVDVLRTEENPAARRGAARALGALPHHLLVAAHAQVVAVLGEATVLDTSDPDRCDAETRVNAVNSLVRLCQVATCRRPMPPTSDAASAEPEGTSAQVEAMPMSVVREVVMQRLLTAAADYATDNRGVDWTSPIVAGREGPCERLENGEAASLAHGSSHPSASEQQRIAARSSSSFWGGAFAPAFGAVPLLQLQLLGRCLCSSSSDPFSGWCPQFVSCTSVDCSALLKSAPPRRLLWNVKRGEGSGFVKMAAAFSLGLT
ncbi:hypothetical protein CYMTET_31431, partial [Cymbomonas tetramitiformis]